MPPQFLLFPPHDHAINEGEIAAQDCRCNPGTRSHGNAQRQNGASEIQRIARVSIRPQYRENFLLVQITRGASANEQSDRSQNCAAQDAAWNGSRHPQHENRERIAQPHAPPRQQLRNVHAVAPTMRRTASNTESTSIASIEASGSLPRLCVVRTLGARSTTSLHTPGAEDSGPR